MESCLKNAISQLPANTATLLQNALLCMQPERMQPKSAQAQISTLLTETLLQLNLLEGTEIGIQKSQAMEDP